LELSDRVVEARIDLGRIEALPGLAAEADRDHD
jgi:hypothetical protein